MQETKARLTNELAGVCREYCLEVWTEALNLAIIPANLELRKVKNIYYQDDFQETLKATLGLRSDAATAPAPHAPK